jgi:hypothetical protein
LHSKFRKNAKKSKKQIFSSKIQYGYQKALIKFVEKFFKNVPKKILAKM